MCGSTSDLAGLSAESKPESSQQRQRRDLLCEPLPNYSNQHPWGQAFSLAPTEKRSQILQINLSAVPHVHRDVVAGLRSMFPSNDINGAEAESC